MQKTALLDIHVYGSLDTRMMRIHVMRLTNVLLMCHQVSSIQPVPRKWEVTSVHLIQVSKAPIILFMIWIIDKTYHVPQMILTKTLSDHLNVLVK